VETGPSVAEGIAYLFLAIGAGKAVITAIAVTVAVDSINLSGGDCADIFHSCPCHKPADICQHTAVVSDACAALGEEEVFLSIDVNNYTSAS